MEILDRDTKNDSAPIITWKESGCGLVWMLASICLLSDLIKIYTLGMVLEITMICPDCFSRRAILLAMLSVKLCPSSGFAPAANFSVMLPSTLLHLG